MTDAQILEAARQNELNVAQINLLNRKAAYEDARIAEIQARAANGTATPTDLANLSRLQAQRATTGNDLQSAQQFAQSLALQQQTLTQSAAQFAQTLGLSQQRLALDERQGRAQQITSLLAALTNASGRISPTLIQEAMAAIRGSGPSSQSPMTPTQPGQNQPGATGAPPAQPELPGVLPPTPPAANPANILATGSPPPEYLNWPSTRAPQPQDYLTWPELATIWAPTGAAAAAGGHAPRPASGTSQPPRPPLPPPAAAAPMAPRPGVPAAPVVPAPIPFNRIGGGVLNTVVPNPYQNPSSRR